MGTCVLEQGVVGAAVPELGQGLAVDEPGRPRAASVNRQVKGTSAAGTGGRRHVQAQGGEAGDVVTHAHGYSRCQGRPVCAALCQWIACHLPPSTRARHGHTLVRRLGAVQLGDGDLRLLRPQLLSELLPRVLQLLAEMAPWGGHAHARAMRVSGLAWDV